MATAQEMKQAIQEQSQAMQMTEEDFDPVTSPFAAPGDMPVYEEDEEGEGREEEAEGERSDDEPVTEEQLSEAFDKDLESQVPDPKLANYSPSPEEISVFNSMAGQAFNEDMSSLCYPRLRMDPP